MSRVDLDLNHWDDHLLFEFYVFISQSFLTTTYTSCISRVFPTFLAPHLKDVPLLTWTGTSDPFWKYPPILLFTPPLLPCGIHLPYYTRFAVSILVTFRPPPLLSPSQPSLCLMSSPRKVDKQVPSSGESCTLFNRPSVHTCTCVCVYTCVWLYRDH